MVEPRLPHIAIVGAGFSGTLATVQLLRQLSAVGAKAHVSLIDKTDRVSRGLAYDTYEDLHLLNVPAGDMSALPDDKLHFYNWVAALIPTVTETSFLPRKLYGRYIAELLRETIGEFRHSAIVQVLKDAARSFDKTRNVLQLQSGKEMRVDYLILATGNFAPKNVLPAQIDTSKFPYFNDPWSLNALSGMTLDEDVLLIGTGLTTVDLALELRGRGHEGKIFALSRNGLLPQMHRQLGAPAPDFLALKPPFPATAREIFQLVRRACAASEMRTQGGWRLAINSLRPHTQMIWQSLPVPEKLRLLRHAKSLWETHRHRMAPNVGSVIKDLIYAGQLQVIAGKITAARPNSRHGVEVSIRRRHQPVAETISVARVINCTGPDLDLRNCSDNFMQALIQSGAVQADPLGLGLLTDDSGAAMTTQGRSPNILVLGALRKGHLWETTAVPELRQQAQQISQLVVTTILSAQTIESENAAEQVLYYGVPTNGVVNGSR